MVGCTRCSNCTPKLVSPKPCGRAADRALACCLVAFVVAGWCDCGNWWLGNCGRWCLSNCGQRWCLGNCWYCCFGDCGRLNIKAKYMRGHTMRALVFSVRLRCGWWRICGSLLRSGENPARHRLWVVVPEGQQTQSKFVWMVNLMIIALLALLPPVFEYWFARSVETVTSLIVVQ